MFSETEEAEMFLLQNVTISYNANYRVEKELKSAESLLALFNDALMMMI